MGGWTRSVAGWGLNVGRDGSGAERRGLVSECQQGWGGVDVERRRFESAHRHGWVGARSVAGVCWVRAGACLCKELTWGG